MSQALEFNRGSSQGEEYISALTSMELCVKTAERYREPINTRLRACCAYVAARVRDDKVRGIVLGVARQPFPEGALKMLRRQLDNMLTTGKPN